VAESAMRAPERMRTSEVAPQGWRRSLVRKYVRFFVALVSGALLTSAVVESWFVYQETRAPQARLQQQVAVSVAERVGESIGQVEDQLDVALQPVWAAGPSATEERRHAFLRLLQTTPSISEMHYVDARGREQLSVSQVDMDAVASQKDSSREAWFQAARRLTSGETYRSPVDTSSGYPYVTLAVPDPGKDGGVTASKVNVTVVWDLIGRVKVGLRGYAYLVDERGQLIGDPDINEVLKTDQDLSTLPQVQAATAAAPSGEAPPDGIWGRDRPDRAVKSPALSFVFGDVLSSYAPVVLPGDHDQQHWSVLVEQPRDDALEPLFSSLRFNAAILVVGLAIAVLASVVLARRMVAPILALQHGAIRIGAGDLDQRIDVKTGDELQALAEHFNDMTEQLRESYATLDAKVAARTEELNEAVHELQTLAAVSRTISSTLDLDLVLTTLVRKAVELSAADSGAIYEFDASAGLFRLRDTHVFDLELAEALRNAPLRMGEGAVGSAGDTRAAVQIQDITEKGAYESPARAALIAAGVRALLAVPLLAEGAVLGGLVIARRVAGEFPPRTVELLQTFAAQSALAMRNALLFEEVHRKSRDLEIANHHKTLLLANVSHELRSPLHVISGFTKTILARKYDQHSEDERQNLIRDRLRRIDSNCTDLLRLINNLLDLSRWELVGLRLSLGDYSLPATIRAVKTAMEPLAEEKGLALRMELPPDMPSGWGDGQRIEQVLRNLLGNAIKFTDEGEVGIRAQVRGDTFLISVWDTGSGIAAEHHRRIFGTFEQGNPGIAQAKGGAGLGLDIARRVVGQHGGHIWVESSPGAGATFRFELPIRTGGGVQHR